MPATDELIGTVFDGRFKVQRILGAGGMGAVYLVHHQVLQREFALKVIHEDLLADPALEQMFRREARAASRVQHPNVTFVYDYSHSKEGVPYIVMEYVEGVTLAREIGQAHRTGEFFPQLRAVDVLAQIADALAAAHACGVVHRDLKPANVALTTRRGRSDFVKVLDFGLAKMQRGGSLNSVDARSIFGTPEYMAPEQCLKVEDVDHRTDIYGLGIVAYETLSGQPPFVGEPLQVLYAHQEKQPKSLLDTLDSEYAPQLEDFVMRCLRKDPDARPQSAAELAGQLRLILASMRAGGGDTIPPATTDQTSPFGAIPTAYIRETSTQVGAEAADLTKTLVSELPAMADASPGDGESHAMEDLVQALREHELGSENLVHLLSRMLELDDGVLEAELEQDLLQGQIVHLEMRTREREARLREALVQVEHEVNRQQSHLDGEPGNEPITKQIHRLTVRATDLANRIRQVSGALEYRLGVLEKQLDDVTVQALARREDAGNLREMLRRQLRGLREQALEAEVDLEDVFKKAGL